MPKTNAKVTGKDLTKEAPRSPRVRLGGFVILPRMIDKCRATLAGKNGDYHFNCELDKRFLTFKSIKADDFKEFVAGGRTDNDILEWVRKNGISKNDTDIADWSKEMDGYAYADDSEGKEWLVSKNKSLAIPSDSTLFDYLDADDKASFSGGSNVCL